LLLFVFLSLGYSTFFSLRQVVVRTAKGASQKSILDLQQAWGIIGIKLPLDSRVQYPKKY